MQGDEHALAERSCTRCQSFRFHDADNCERRSTGERVPTKGRPMSACLEKLARLTMSQARTNGYAVTKRFCQAHNVGNDIAMLMCKPPTGTTHPSLNFVKDQ